MDFFAQLFDTSGFPPRWHCGYWTAAHGWLHILSDLAIWMAYFAIPVVLGYFILQRQDLPFRKVFALFVAFILLCGSTHLMEAIIFWWPAYRLAGLIKLLTAVVSWVTVVALVQVAPQVVRMRSPEELEREIVARKEAERRLQDANVELEWRVEERTKELTQTVAALRGERELLHTTLASIGDAVITTDIEARITNMNAVAESLTGWTSAESAGRPLEAVLHIVNAETSRATENPAARAVREAKTVSLANDTILIAKDGTQRPIDDSAAPIRSAGGEVVGCVLVFRDISERRRQEAELRNQERQFRTLAESIPQLCWMANADGHIFWYNRRWYDYTGTTLEQMEGWSWQSVHDPDELPKVLMQWKKSITSGQRFDMTFPLKGRDDQLRMFLTRIEPVKDEEGRVIRWFGTNTDVTEHKRVEQRLQANEDRLRMALAAARMVAWQFDPASDAVEFSDNAADVFGLPPGATLEKASQAFALLHPDDVHRHRATVLRAVEECGSYLSEFRMVRQDNGGVIWLEERGHGVRDGQSKTVRLVGVVMDVTERKQAERESERLAALVEQERRLSAAVLTNTPDFIYTFDLEGRFVYANSSLLNLWEKTLPEAVGKNFFDLDYPPELAERLQRQIRQVIDTRQSLRDETPYTSAAGERSYEYIFVPILGAGGAVEAVAGSTRDITDRKRTEEALRDKRERLQAALDGSGAGTFRWNIQTNALDWDENLDRLFGLPAGRTIRSLENFIATVHPDERAGVIERCERCARDGVDFDMEFRVIWPDGSVHWLDDKGQTVCDEAGRPFYMAGMCIDVTDRKRVDAALRESEERFRTAIAAVSDLIWTNNADGLMVGEQPGWGNFTGQSRAEYQGYGWSKAVHPEDAQPTIDAWQQAVAGRRTFTFEHRVRRRDGEWRLCAIRAVPILNADGSIREWVGVHTDITERMRAEDEARKAQEIFKLVHGIGRIGHWEWNSLTNENTWSPEIEALYGLPPGGFGRTYESWAKLLHPADLPKAEEDVRRAFETGKYFTEFRVIWADGSVHWLEARAYVFKDANDKPVRLMGVNMDITERKRIEEALQDADRRKDEFLATLAHELRNPLAPIRNGLQLMKLAGNAGQSAEQVRAMMERQLSHLVRLVDDLMDMSRITRGNIELRKESIPLATVVTSAVEASRPLIEEMGHELEIALPEQPMVVDADRTRLAQVFTNLLNNAAKYSERGGHIWLTAERQGSDVVVSVRDTGIGIAADQMSRVFDMFAQVDQSLEKSQGGLGLGLTLVQRLVEMHGGRVEAKSAGLGRGSEFIVRLPITVNPPHSPPAEPITISCRRILIVDDNRDGADSLAMVLRITGNEIRTAYDGEEALSAAEDFRPDVILLDIGMPKINGYEACRRIREQPWGKEMVLIAVTGWGQKGDRHRSHDAGFDQHMVKPVDPQALMKVLAGLRFAKA